MSNDQGSAADLVERIKRKSPEYLDLLTAETEAEFEDAFDVLLERVIIHMETNKKNFKDLDEAGLCGVLGIGLNIPGLSVSQETNSNGHVDLTIEADHCSPVRKKLGEAKIYRGPKYHFDGLDQLLNRYTTGRESRGLLIVYFREKEIAVLVRKLRDEMDCRLPHNQQGHTSDHKIKWSFLSKHAHSSGDNLQVGHIGCNLYVEPYKAPLK